MLALSLAEIVPKDSFDIYQNTRKGIINKKPDSVTQLGSHSQKKAQIHKQLPRSPRPMHLKPILILTAK